MTSYTGNISHSYQKDYSHFLKFLETFTPSGFNDIKRDDPFIMELERTWNERPVFHGRRFDLHEFSLYQ